VRILLDNCVPYRVRELFPGHEVVHTSDIGFENLYNGDLITQAATAGFDILVTTDKNIRYEHNLANVALPIVELNTRFTRFSDLRTLTPHLESALIASREFAFVSVGADGTLEKLGERTT